MPNLRSWKEYHDFARPFPYVREFGDDTKRLLYFGSKHIHNWSDRMFSEIRENFSRFAPEVVLVEGVQQLRRAQDTEGRADLLAELKQQKPEDIIQSWGEPGYTAWLADQSGLPLFSPEPDGGEEVFVLEQEGFSRDNIFLHYLLRDIDQYHRMTGIKFDEYFSRSLQKFVNQSGWTDFDYSLKHLQEIAERIWPGKIDFLDIEFVKEKVWPTKWETVVNKIARSIGDFRDQCVISEIKYHFQEHDRVFIVYGGSHLIRQEPVLAALFDA